MRKKVAVFLTLILLLTPVYASKLTDKKNQLKDTKESIQNTKEELKETLEERKEVKSEIQKVDNLIMNAENKLQSLEKQLKEKQAALENSEEELETAIVKKDRQYEAAKKRMVQMYKNQRIGYIQVVFSSKNFWEAINRMEYVKRISQQDNNLIETYQEQVELIDEQKAKIEDEKAELDVLHKAQVAKKSDLVAARAEKARVLTKLAGEQERLQAEIREMEKISKDLEKEIKRLTAASTIKYSGGAFNWPVPGHYGISSGYNPRTSPISGRSEFHTGIDIPAPYGSSVVAAADGVVITSGWVNGYGNTVMINHGSGLVTLYGHNSSLDVSVGQQVARGQRIAGIGSTGYSTGNHCHFEVRKNGGHTNPLAFLGK